MEVCVQKKKRANKTIRPARSVYMLWTPGRKIVLGTTKFDYLCIWLTYIWYISGMVPDPGRPNQASRSVPDFNGPTPRCPSEASDVPRLCHSSGWLLNLKFICQAIHLSVT